MSYENFITNLLNIKPSDLSSISTATKSDGSIIINIKLLPKPIVCPYCSGKVIIQGYYKRKLTHSTFANRNCYIVYNQRRYRCSYCNVTFNENNPFSNPRDTITYETKLNILNDLKHPEATYTSIAQKYNTSTNNIIRIFDKHVDIPRKKLPAVLSIDEHYFPSSDYNAKYCCLLMDFVTGEIIDVIPDRKKNFLSNYFSSIKRDTFDHTTKTSELDNVEYISIDMYENFRDVAKTYFPKAKICADSFHVIKHLTDDFRKIRNSCRNSTENPILKYLLSKFRKVCDHRYQKLLDNEPKYNKRLGEYINYRGIRDILFRNLPVLKTAFELKEFYIALNSQTSLETAPIKIAEAIRIFADCGIEEYEEFHTLLVNWREEIINSFTVIEGKRINNSYIESKNRIVARLIYNANGFTNFNRTRNRILYCLNIDDTFKF